MSTPHNIVGRYAPSPTGPLHIGNLRTALLAWLHVRLQGGRFLLRMEDLDLPRVVDSSADSILRDLEWLGLDWDGEVVYQSQRTGLYQAALSQLEQQNLVYDCFCSRKDIQQAASAPHGKEGVYPRTCVDLDSVTVEQKRQQKAPAVRVRVNDKPISFNDGCVGPYQQTLTQACGDFVIKRADGLFAYQLAVVVDDLEQGVTDVVRGADLIDSTARQIYLAEQLQPDASTTYWHVPLMLDDHGQRMAKRDGSLSIAEWREDGSNAEQLVGLLASSLGIIETSDVLSATDLLSELTIERWVERLYSVA